MSKMTPDQQILNLIEAERKRIARDIHDGPAQNLANIVVRIDLCEKLLKKNFQEGIEELHLLKEMVKNSLQEIKNFIFNIRPMSLDDLGLIPALKKHIEKYEKEFGIKVELIIMGEEKKATPEYEVGIFRIIQEALSNIAKHSGAKSARILIEYENSSISINIVDYGCGFDVKKILLFENKNLGLVSMKERTELLGGTFQISSNIGQGTKITIKIPFSNP